MAKKRSKPGKSTKGETISRIGRKCCLRFLAAPVIVEAPIVVKTSELIRTARESFNMIAVFRDAQPPPDDGSDPGPPDLCMCSCCEFRHYVRGLVRYDGMKKNFMLADGALLDEVIWQEVSNDGPEGPLRYGHRDEPDKDKDQYEPEREDGCAYFGFNDVSLTGTVGFRFEIDLEFRGDIVDVCAGEFVVESRTWKFQMKGVLSTRRSTYTVGGR